MTNPDLKQWKEYSKWVDKKNKKIQRRYDTDLKEYSERLASTMEAQIELNKLSIEKYGIPHPLAGILPFTPPAPALIEKSYAGFMDYLLTKTNDA